MPRSNRPRRRGRPVRSAAAPGSGSEPADELDLSRALAGFERPESAPDGDWLVRAVAGPQAVKAYRCPGCDQEIRPGVPHLVVWRADPIGPFGDVTDRRHWHTPCWRARLTRRR